MNGLVKKKKKIFNNMHFLLAVISLYIIVYFFNSSLVLNSLANTALMLIKISPILILIFIIIYIINKYFSIDKIKKYFGHEAGIKGWIYAMIVGIILAGPPYVLYPLFGELQKQGVKNSFLAVVLYNRNVKLQFIPAMVYYFGLPFSIILSIYMLIFSIFNGLLLGALTDKD